MKTRIVLSEQHYEGLKKLVFDCPGVEGAAFLLCGQVKTATTTKLVSHAVIPVDAGDYLRREPYALSINSHALTRVAKLARYERLSVIFVHSHPEGIPHFSLQDDKEEEKLLPFLQSRVPGRMHGTLVLTEDSIAGRIYSPERREVDSVLVIGDRIRVFNAHNPSMVSQTFDRQVRAFGKDVQNILQSLHVGIVGLGGTGSPIAEQLCRLGVKNISLFDGDKLDETNVNRVYGSSLADAGKFKVDIAKRSIERIGLGTNVVPYPRHITDLETAKELRNCDVIFGCTDKQIPRAILNQLALAYLVSVFDIGVLIDSENHQIRGIHGRVTALHAGAACLFCRGRISPEVMRQEALSVQDREAQIKEGYAPELDDPAPAVIAFTTAISSAAVGEFLHRITGFMGEERKSTEVLYSFDESRIRTNRVQPREGCACSDTSDWGRGDVDPFLGMMWATTPT